MTTIIRTCKIDGCDGLVNTSGSGRGMCSKHYQRLRRHGDPLIVTRHTNEGRECSVDGCGNEAYARGWCAKHYSRWRTHGHVEDTRRVSTDRRHVTLSSMRGSPPSPYRLHERPVPLLRVRDRPRRVGPRRTHPPLPARHQRPDRPRSSSMTFIKSGDLSKIAKRHSDIPQDALPIEIPEPPKSNGGTASQASPKSVKYAHCPFHAQDGTGRQTGLIAVKAGEFVFRDHTKRIGKVTVQCPGSGRPAPAAPGDD